MNKAFGFFLFALIVCVGIFIGYYTLRSLHENKILKEVIHRLEADSRIAEVLVTDVHYDENTQKTFTTIKFLEYEADGNALRPRYFTLPGNVIQFQSLVIRFDDFYVRKGDPLRGKSASLFWKVFVLDGPNTVEYEITKAHEIPQGYDVEHIDDPFEQKLWKEFWTFALDPTKAKRTGIKNVQIEAPGTMFIPGTLYTINIEHDGGIRIDVHPLPEILKGESIPQ
ncbi:hypothetical protein ACFL1E_03400 [Candidatus Omnitrophota bacterium]